MPGLTDLKCKAEWHLGWLVQRNGLSSYLIFNIKRGRS